MLYIRARCTAHVYTLKIYLQCGRYNKCISYAHFVDDSFTFCDRDQNLVEEEGYNLIIDPSVNNKLLPTTGIVEYYYTEYYYVTHYLRSALYYVCVS